MELSICNHLQKVLFTLEVFICVVETYMEIQKHAKSKFCIISLLNVEIFCKSIIQ